MFSVHFDWLLLLKRSSCSVSAARWCSQFVLIGYYCWNAPAVLVSAARWGVLSSQFMRSHAVFASYERFTVFQKSGVWFCLQGYWKRFPGLVSPLSIVGLQLPTIGNGGLRPRRDAVFRKCGSVNMLVDIFQSSSLKELHSYHCKKCVL